MKKFFTLIILLFTTCFCLAAENPRWVGQPIYVYIPQYGNMSKLMAQAFKAWETTSKGLVRFKFVPDVNNANIIVEFVDFVTNCGSDSTVGCCRMYHQKGNYYKAYVTIGTKEYQRSGYTQQIVTRSKAHIYGVMLHEAGHAIGLDHSPHSGSIMYPYDLDSLQYLTKTDMQLLYKKYH